MVPQWQKKRRCNQHAHSASNPCILSSTPKDSALAGATVQWGQAFASGHLQNHRKAAEYRGPELFGGEVKRRLDQRL